MRIIDECKVINNNGDSIQFGRHFKLLKDIDLSGLKADVSYSENSNDGANYQRTVLDIRDIDVQFYIPRRGYDQKWYEEKRRELFAILNPKHNPMRMEFKTKSGEEYYLNLNLEHVPSLPQAFEDSNMAWQKGLAQFTCDDPFIYSSASTVEDIAVWVPNFEFPLDLPVDGMEISYRSPSLIKNVFNDGSNDIGMTIEFKATASVENPSLINVNNYEQLKLNTTLLAGDVIRVNTEIGKKSVVLIRNNVVSDAFHTVDLLSTFLQLEPGDNLFRYDADNGLDNLEVRMIFTSKFMGV